jgi:competence protein ComEA
MDAPKAPLTPNPSPSPSPEKGGENTHPSLPGKGVGELGSASPRSAQVALALCIAVLLGLLAYRGYGNRLGTRPTETVTARVDLNDAARAELEQVPHVGPKLAQAIDDHRKTKGPFKSVEELRDVKGVGPATFDKVRPYLRVEAPRAPAASAAETDPPILERKKAAPETKAASPPMRTAGVRKLQPGDPPININTGTYQQLLQLPDVGPVTAQAIVAARAEKPFRTLADLDAVKGIGPKKLEKLKQFVVFE